MPEPTTAPSPKKTSGWEWRRPPGHENQPLVEWWVEQVAVVITLIVARRAHRRGDRQTLDRMLAVFRAGGEAERAAATEEAPADA